MKQCPFCAEAIQDAAIVCRYCGRDLKPPLMPRSSQPSQPPTPPGLGRGAVVLLSIGALLIAVWFVGQVADIANQTTRPTTKTAENPPLKAAASFSGVQVTVANNDAFDWSDVKLELNGGLLSSGYTYRADSIASGNRLTVPVMQFAKSDGTRFNPIEIKPQSITVYARVDGETRLSVLNWK